MMTKLEEIKKTKRVACPVCGRETLLTVEPGTNIYVCPGCGSVNLVLVDANLDVRQVRHVNRAEVIDRPTVRELGRLELDTGLMPFVPETLRPYIDDIMLLLEGGERPERVRGDVLLALEALRRLGMVRERGEA